MFNTTIRRLDVAYRACLHSIGLLLVCWALSPATAAEIVSRGEWETTAEAMHKSQSATWTAAPSVESTADTYPRANQSKVAAASVHHLNDYRVCLTEPGLQSVMHDRLLSAAGWQVHMTHGQAQICPDGSGLAKDVIVIHESGLDPNAARHWISDPVSIQNLILAEYINGSSVSRKSQIKMNGSDLTNPIPNKATSGFLKSPEKRFRIHTVYKKTITQRSWLDRYANSYHGASNAIHPDCDAIFPSVEYIDKSLTAVYRPEGKALSLRYEDREGSSVYSEITLFF